MKKNLTVYAGAILLTGALTSCGISLVNANSSQNLDFSIDVNGDLKDAPITCAFLDYTLEDGTLGYALPSGYEPYYVDSSFLELDYVNKVVETKEYTVYVGSRETLNGEIEIVPMDGYIGVNEYYLYNLNQLDSLKAGIKGKNSLYTCELTKIDISTYSLPLGYHLYNLNGYVENTSSYYEKDNQRVYLIDDNQVQDYVGITNDVYSTIVQLESIQDAIEEGYYNEKTNSRS